MAAKNTGQGEGDASVLPCSPTVTGPKAYKAAAAGALASIHSALHSSGGPLLEQALRPTYEHSVVAPALPCEAEMVRNGTSATEIGQEGYADEG